MSSEIHPERPDDIGGPTAPEDGLSPASEEPKRPPEAGAQPEMSASVGRTQLSPTQIWGLRDLLFFLLFIPISLIIANLVALAAYAALKPLMGWQLSPLSLSRNTFFLLALQSVFYAFVLGWVYLLARIHHQQPFWRSLGWHKPSGKQASMFLGGGVLLALMVNLIPPILPESGTFPLQRFFSSPAASYAVGVFAVFIAPLVEETVFRGLLFAIFERSAGLPFAIITTAVLFAGLHVPEYWRAWNHVLMILVVGLVLSLARGMTGSLAPSIILHVGYNTCMMAGLYFTTQHFREIQGLLWP